MAIKKAESILDDRLFCCAYLYDIEHSLVTVRYKLFNYTFI
nr:MAG TPA: YfcL protein [Caudoviricetes sp.]